MRNILLMLLLPILFSSDISAQVSPGVEFFPMQIGNTWIYNYSNGTIRKFKILDTLTSFGKVYYYCEENPFTRSGWVRVDSLTGSLLKLDSNSNCGPYPTEAFVDSLGASLNENVINCESFQTSKCNIHDTSIWLGQNYERKGFNFEFHGGGFHWIRGRIYLKNIGPLHYGNSSFGNGGGSSEYYTLKGCIINGVVYGDTAITSISVVSNEIPTRYSLSQNYPNPFNPGTTISFSIPKAGFVTLKVYNVLGEEVKSLVDQQLSAGSYDFDFDASDLSSGMYFYTLKSGEFSETKKMMLVK